MKCAAEDAPKGTQASNPMSSVPLQLCTPYVHSRCLCCATFAGHGPCTSVELRALCSEPPPTPPGPEGSNGNGKVSCAAEYPKFLVLPSNAGDGSVKLVL